MPYSNLDLIEIFNKTGGRCYHCRKTLARKNYGIVGAKGAWEVDHSNPRALGGTDYLRNLVPSCISCNRSKGASHSRQYREKTIFRTIISHPERFPELFKKKRKRKRKRSFGISIADASRMIASDFPVLGAYIGTVKVNSPAQRAGLQIGDIILQVNDSIVANANELENRLRRMNTGKTIHIIVKRGEGNHYIHAKR